MPLVLSNFGRTTLTAGLTNIATGAGAIQVADGSLFPSFSAGDYTYLVLEDASKNREVVKINGRTGNAIDVSARAQDGTLARAWTAGDVVSLRLVRVMLTEILADVLGLHTSKENTGVAASGMSAHLLDSNPHTQYALASAVASALAGKQAADAFLDALALLGTTADRLIYVTGPNAASEMVFNAAARLLLTDMKFSGVYGEKVNALGTISGAQGIDNALGTYVTATIGGITNFATGGFTNPIASGYVGGFILELTNGGAFGITWPTSVKWPGGTPPLFTTAGVDILMFTTRDGGTTWRGSLVQKDSK